MPPLRNSEFHDQRCFAQLLAFVGRVGLRAFFRSSAEREMGVCYLIRGSNASSKKRIEQFWLKKEKPQFSALMERVHDAPAELRQSLLKRR